MMFNSSEEMIKTINQRMNYLLNQVKKKHRILFTLSCKPIQATDENYNETAFKGSFLLEGKQAYQNYEPF